mgnify:CR=1 FL=1
MFNIAIPSLSRVNQLKNKTYKFLKDEGFDDSEINIFVIDKEYDEYRQSFPLCNIIIGRLGVRNQKNYIQDYFESESYVLQLDDDIEGYYHCMPQICPHTYEEKGHKLISTPFKFHIDSIINKMIECDTTLWAPYPCPNPFFMNKATIKDNELCYCAGAMILYKNLRLMRTYDIIEDFDFSLLHHTHGKIYREAKFTCKAGAYINPGGIQTLNIRNKNTKLQAVQKFVNQYPNFAKLKMKSDGWADIKFINSNANKKNKKSELWSICYWDFGKKNDLFICCIHSWLKLGYTVNLICNEPVAEYFKNTSNINCIVETVTHPDLTRFKYLAENANRTFIDCDILLKQKLPDQDIIFSSEQTRRTGAMCPKNNPDYQVVNIGILKYHNPIFWQTVYAKCLTKPEGKNNRYMNIFKSLHTKEKLPMSPWYSYCPLNWANVKEGCRGNKLNSKYGQVIYNLEQILEKKEIIGIHLWNSMLKEKIRDNSLIHLLLVNLGVVGHLDDNYIN